MITGAMLISSLDHSRSQQLANEEAISREAFFERCMHNPSMRDRLPILTRSLDMNRKVRSLVFARCAL